MYFILAVAFFSAILQIHRVTSFKSSLFDTSEHKCFSKQPHNRAFVNQVTKIECGMLCVKENDCKAACYNASEGTCYLVTLTMFKATYTVDCSDCVILRKRSNYVPHTFQYETSRFSWQLMFRATAGINISVYESFLGTNTLPAPTDQCQSMKTLQCRTHYRNPKIDRWEQLKIKQVRVELYKDGIKVAYVLFGGYPKDRSMNKTSWFNQKYVKDSSWKDLTQNVPLKFFSLEGYTFVDRIARRFYIIKEHKKCETDTGWMMIVDHAKKGACSFDLRQPRPLFVYSVKDHFVQWSVGNYGYADVLAVYAEVFD